MVSNRAKRIVDLIGATAGILALSPVFLLIIAILKITSKEPVFFRQTRPGVFGKPFLLIKFRTMANLLDETGRLLPDDLRLTPIGQVLRSTSLDELPELYNVLKGDMSLVGPRPLLMRYLDRYSPEQARRHAVKPGLTGWAQINGRNAISWEEKLRLDTWYVDHRTFRLDIQIILLTIKKVVMREGINHRGEATMSEFVGTWPTKNELE